MKEKSQNIIDWELISSILDGDATQEEKINFENWLRQNNNKEYFEEIKKTWIKSGELSYCYTKETNNAWQQLADKTIKQKTNANTITLKVLKIAATIALLIILTNIFFINNKKELITVNDIIEDYRLPDSSSISLNRNSKISFNESLDGDKRELWLEGEAFFKVKRNPQKPFIVNTENGLFEVLGTSFNIKEDKENNTLQLDVKTGKVKFLAFEINQQITAIKNQSIIYNLKNKSLQKVQQNINYLAWKTKVLKFDNTSLREIAKCLQSVYHKDIIIKDKDLENLMFSGSFNNQEFEKVLLIIITALEIKINETNKTIELLKIAE